MTKAFLLALAFASYAMAILNPAPPCTANAGTPPVLRAESVTEVTAEIVISCNGGQIRTAGQPVPLVNIQLSVNTRVTSKILSSGFSEALVAIDDPAGSAQTIGSESPALVSTGSSAYPMGAPLLYRARPRGITGLTFTGVPIVGGTHTFRIMNLRVDATQLPAGSSVEVGVAMTWSNGGSSITIGNSTVIVGTTIRSVNFVILGGSANSAVTSSGLFMEVRYQELTPNAIRVRNIAVNGDPTSPPLAQNQIPGQRRYETGFFNPSLDPSMGLADSGTRFFLLMKNIPVGMRIFVKGINESGNGESFRALNSCFGAAVLKALQGNSFFEATIVNGVMLVCWEAVSSDPNVANLVRFLIDEIYTGPPLMQTELLKAEGGIGPILKLADWVTESNLSTPRFGAYLDDTVIPTMPDRDMRIMSSQTNRRWPYVSAGELRGTTGSGMVVPDWSCDNIFASKDPLAFENEGCRVRVYGTGAMRPSTLTVSQTALLGAQFFPGIRAGTTNWLTATLTSTATPADVILTANPAGLIATDYTGTATVSSGTGGVSPVTAPVTLTVPPAGPLIKSLGFGVANAGSYASNMIAPGEAVVVFGSNFGPQQLATLKLTNGVTDTILGGTRVLFDGIPGPMIYAVNGLASCFVPFGIATERFVDVEVEYNGVKSPAVRVRVAPTLPALLTADASGGGQGAIHTVTFQLNGEVGSLPNDVVVLYGVGGGETVPAALDGRVNAGGSLKATVRKVFLDGVEVPSEYFGPAPGQIEGVFQVNLRLPTNVRRNANVPVQVQIGDLKSQPGVTIRVK